MQLESRFLTDELQLQIAQPLVSRNGMRAHAEYRFNDIVSAQAQWKDEDPPPGTPWATWAWSSSGAGSSRMPAHRPSGWS